MDDVDVKLYYSDIVSLSFINLTAMPAPVRSIPLYSLYGEKTAIEDIEFVHVEPIASRSKLYDWEIGPHTHESLFQIMVIAAGSCEVLLDNDKSRVSGPCLILLPAGTVHGFTFEPETQGKIISVASSFLGRDTHAGEQEILDQVLHQNTVLSFHKSPGHFQVIQNLTHQLYHEFRYPQLGRAMIFDALLRALLVLVRRQISLKQQHHTQHGQQRILFNQYRSLIEDHYKESWTIGEYAGHMCITESKLNRICRLFTEQSAFEVLQDRVLLEAQRHLIYTAAPLSEIAYDLGFNDSAYFCRYFKKRTGITPKNFRRDHRLHSEVSTSIRKA